MSPFLRLAFAIAFALLAMSAVVSAQTADDSANVTTSNNNDTVPINNAAIHVYDSCKVECNSNGGHPTECAYKCATRQPGTVVTTFDKLRQFAAEFRNSESSDAADTGSSSSDTESFARRAATVTHEERPARRQPNPYVSCKLACARSGLGDSRGACTDLCRYRAGAADQPQA